MKQASEDLFERSEFHRTPTIKHVDYRFLENTKTITANHHYFLLRNALRTGPRPSLAFERQPKQNAKKKNTQLWQTIFCGNGMEKNGAEMRVKIDMPSIRDLQ